MRTYFLSDLPEVNIETLTDIPQKSIITDRNWEILYTFFEQDREYISYDDIPDQVIQAFLSAEDRNYRDHSGVDSRWIARAVINNIKYVFTDSQTTLQWASTIQQQLVKNLYLTHERSIKRKVQEILLTKKINKILDKKAKEDFPDMKKSDRKRYAKEKILEIYLNLIFLGNNAYWIETASKNYFDKNLEKVTLLESAILWALPKAPSTYNPLIKRKNMMGDRFLSDGDQSYFLEDTTTYGSNFLKQIREELHKKVSDNKINYLDPERITRLRSWEIQNNWSSYQYEYTPWRKDHILRSMYQEGYIDHTQLTSAFLEWIDYSFNEHSYDIKAPHFVFYIQKFLLTSPLLEELWMTLSDMLQWGYTVKTSIDIATQELAQQAANESFQDLINMWGNNRALLHVNSRNGDILAYLASQDYYSQLIQGKFDVIQAKRQHWSTVKPFIYARLLELFPIWADWGILDYSYNLWGWYSPQNADGKFLGRMTISSSLSNSRNRTAIRAFLAIWWEKAVLPYFESLWFKSMTSKHSYGYTLALWAAENSLLNLAQAYLQLSNQDFNKEVPFINPILEIRDANGEIVYAKEDDESSQKRIIPRWVAYLMRNILSNQKQISSSRRSTLTYNQEGKYAIKSWTTDMKIYGKTYAKDWLVSYYTPQDTIITRAGNNDNQPLWENIIWSVINKPFLQRYLDKYYGKHGNYEWSYTLPEDLHPRMIYKETKFPHISPRIQEILREK